MSRIVAKSLLLLAATLGVLSSASAELGVGAVISQDEVKIIVEWYRDRDATPYPGGGKKKAKGLPPGIAKNLARGKPLPPGIAKQYLPDGLRRLLSAPPAGYERIIVDGKVLLVEIASRVIHDMLEDAILR